MTLLELPGLGRLTTEHAASPYGRPVLIVADVPYGPGDALPDGRSVADAVRQGAQNAAPDAAGLALIRKFLDEAPPTLARRPQALSRSVVIDLATQAAVNGWPLASADMTDYAGRQGWADALDDLRERLADRPALLAADAPDPQDVAGAVGL